MILKLVPETSVDASNGSVLHVDKRSLGRFFCQIDGKIFSEFEETSNPTKGIIVGYDVVQMAQEYRVIEEAASITRGVVVSLADICTAVREHQIVGRKILKVNGMGNVFFSENKYGKSCQISILSTNFGFSINYHGPIMRGGKEVVSSIVWPKGRRIFIHR